MITPGLLRRSLVRAAQWRLLALQLILLALSGWVAVQPWADFLERQLAFLPDVRELTNRLSAPVALDLIAQLGGPESGHPEQSILMAAVLALLFGALFAGATLAEATSEEPLSSRELFAGGATFFGRMFRTLFAALIPVGLSGALVASVVKWSESVRETAVTESAASGNARLSAIIAGLVVVLVILWLDAARAQFAAQPVRRSAFFAVFAGGLLLLRRPLRSVWIGLGTLSISLVVASLFLLLRHHLEQASAGKILLALLLSQLALASLAWGRAARLIAFCELARADVLDRAQPPGTFEMDAPRTSPPAPVGLVPAVEMVGTPIIGTPMNLPAAPTDGAGSGDAS